MSLKKFHLLFIVLAILTCLGFGAWALLVEGLPDNFRVMGWISAGLGVLLVGYGIYFVRKAKTVIT
ncbi:MAG: hypothetical protein HKN23_12860 [Verrucomicrobiales bacterium]|nr:hypothetical protein [Verrucomicrobiales bacterium]